MNADIKVKWIAALRSGAYEQGQNRLRTGDKFCCLGVLCDLYSKEGYGGRWVPNAIYDGASAFELDGGCGSGYGLPAAVAVWAGTPQNIVVADVGRTVGVDELNDGGKTFAQIADAIEEQL